VPTSFPDRRRIVDPDVRGDRYDVVAPRPGIFAYGVAAVDAQGQQADSDVFFFVIPTVDVDLTDIAVAVEGERITLGMTVASAEAAELAAWMRAEDRTSAGDAAAEWGRGDHVRVAVTTVRMPGRYQLAWPADPGRHVVLLEARDATGTRILGPWTVTLAGKTRLHSPAPHPFRPGGVILFDLAARGRTRLEVLRTDGRRVRSLWSAALAAGTHRVHWDGRDDSGRDVASGVYLLRLQAGAESSTQRLVLVH
jgi:hypothetical protein